MNIHSKHVMRIPYILMLVAAAGVACLSGSVHAASTGTPTGCEQASLLQHVFDPGSSWTSTTSIADKDSDGLSDALEARLETIDKADVPEGQRLLTIEDVLPGGKTPQLVDNRILDVDAIPVIVSFPPGQDISDVVPLFEQLGGSIKSTYDKAINGFGGSIALEGLGLFRSSLQASGRAFFIEEDGIAKTQLYYASRNMNLRPLTWTTYGFNGDPATSVAVIDSGIDDAHSAFAPGYSPMNASYKVTGWSDQVNGISSPYDDMGHGSHCAGIVAGSGSYAIDGSSRVVATHGFGFNYYGYYLPNMAIDMVAAKFNVTQTGSVEIQCQFDDLTPGSSDLLYMWAYLKHGTTVVDSYTSDTTSWTDTLTYAVTAGNLGEYSLELHLRFYGYDGMCDNPYMRFRGILHWPFNPPALGSSNLWQGVAPDTRLVGVKVVDDEGAGTATDIIDGVNWAITNKLAYNITVISMSLGMAAGQTSLINAVNNAVNGGIVTVVAAGNDGPGADNVGSPGDADNVITVAAMSTSDHVTEYSSQGGASYTALTNKPDIMAPGGSDHDGSMFSVDTGDNDVQTFMTDGFANDLAPMLGTSMATPAVAGAASLVIDALGGRGNWHYLAEEARGVKAILLATATETYPLLREGATSVYSPLLNRGTKDVHEGYGRINVDAAIEAVTVNALGTTLQPVLLEGSAVNASGKHAMAAYATLVAGTPYAITLQVPDGADFDLHVYSSTPSSIGEPVQAASSTSAVIGQDEGVIFTPITDGKYYIVAKAISGRGNAELAVRPNLNSPALTSPAVTPSIGNQTTLFKFSAVYTDPDNNAPFTINTNVSGLIIPMSKSAPADNNYTDGCTYEGSTYLQPGAHTYRISCSDGIFTNTTSAQAGPTVISWAGTHAPLLANLTLSPSQGTNVTSFQFTVDYIDQDNNLPAVITLYVNSTGHAMLPVDASDVNVMDGKQYIYVGTLAWGNYQHHVNCSDGTFVASTAAAGGPLVQPFSGIGGNLVLFQDDFESGTGKWQTITDPWHLTDSSSAWSSPYHSPTHSMWCGNEQTGQYPNNMAADLVSVPFDMTAMKQARLELYFWCSLESSYDYFRIYIRRNATTAWSTLYSSSASRSPWYLFTYDITSYCGAGAGAVQLRFYTTSDYSYTYRGVLIDDIRVTGSSLPVPSTPANASHVAVGNVTFSWSSLNLPFGAVTYRWQLGQDTSFSPALDEAGDIPEGAGTTSFIRNVTRAAGTYYWRVRAETGGYTTPWSYPRYFYLSNQPSMSGGAFNPATGNPTTLFTFNVTYIDLDNNAPNYINLHVNASTYAMAKHDAGDTTYTDGCLYTTSITLPPGTTIYYFRSSDGIFIVATASWAGPTVTNTAPALTSPSMSPASGTPTTWFNYSVVYTDAENMAPSYVRVYIDGSYYAMAKQNAGDVTYTDGCTYVYSRTLAPGSHNYYFATSDGYLTNQTTSTPGPSVTNTAPALTGGAVTPGTGFPTTTFNYSVVYTDAENMAPSYVRVYIDGSYYAMAKQNAGDVTYTDGCTYVYSRTLAPGSHNHYFAASDGYQNTQTTTTSGPSVTNTAPALTGGMVTPGTGSPTTMFTFSVVYTDAENMAPSYLWLYIAGYMYTTYKQNTGDVTYTDGCTYLSTLNLQPGSYTYYFATSDGYLTNQTATSSGPEVVNHAPTLTAGGVTPTSAAYRSQGTFMFTVTYTDEDNNAPSYVYAYIDGSFYDMQKEDPYDSNYADGCVYYLAYTVFSDWNRLGVGDHEFWFAAGDGWEDAATPRYSGPTITQFSDAEVTAFTIFLITIPVLLVFGITMAKVHGKKQKAKMASRRSSSPSGPIYSKSLYPTSYPLRTSSYGQPPVSRPPADPWGSPSLSFLDPLPEVRPRNGMAEPARNTGAGTGTVSMDTQAGMSPSNEQPVTLGSEIPMPERPSLSREDAEHSAIPVSPEQPVLLATDGQGQIAGVDQGGSPPGSVETDELGGSDAHARQPLEAQPNAMQPLGSTLECLGMACENCLPDGEENMSYQAIGRRFCTKCGGPLAYMFHCRYCNQDFTISREYFEQQDGLRFCPRCGSG